MPAACLVGYEGRSFRNKTFVLSLVIYLRFPEGENLFQSAWVSVDVGYSGEGRLCLVQKCVWVMLSYTAYSACAQETKCESHLFFTFW
jgi:hypothetical protein